MNVVLIEKVDRLGDLGDVVEVAPGYARNYLVPYGKACYATADNIKRYEQKRIARLQAEQQRLDDARQRQQQLQGAAITVAARASDSTKLFGSVTATDIIEMIKNACGVDVDKKEIAHAPNIPIKALGEHQLSIQLHADVKADITVRVVAESG